MLNTITAFYKLMKVIKCCAYILGKLILIYQLIDKYKVVPLNTINRSTMILIQEDASTFSINNYLINKKMSAVNKTLYLECVH